MPLLDLFQMPDQMLLVASFLDVHELLALYRSSKKIWYSIPFEIVAQCREDTETRYTRAIFMPDGFIRVFSRYGRRVYDIYAIPEGLVTPVQHQHPFLLKTAGYAIQKGSAHIISITDADGQKTFPMEYPPEGYMNFFNAKDIHITNVYHMDGTTMRLEMVLDDLKVLDVYISFKQCTPYAPFNFSERTAPTRKANPKITYPAFML